VASFFQNPHCTTVLLPWTISPWKKIAPRGGERRGHGHGLLGRGDPVGQGGWTESRPRLAALVPDRRAMPPRRASCPLQPWPNVHGRGLRARGRERGRGQTRGHDWLVAALQCPEGTPPSRSAAAQASCRAGGTPRKGMSGHTRAQGCTGGMPSRARAATPGA
jgi:hypothetical protein